MLRDVLLRAKRPRDPYKSHWILLKLWPPHGTHPSHRNRRSKQRARFPPPHGIQSRSPAGEREAELEKSEEKPSKNTTEGARTHGMCGWLGRRESSWRQRPHLPRPPACRSLPAAEPPCALPRPRRPGLPRRRGPGHVWRTRRRRPGVTYIRDGRPGPPEAPAGPRCASGGAGLCGSGAPGTRWYGRKGRKGGTKAEGRAGVAVAATSAASSSSSSCPRRAPSPTQPSPRSRYVPVPVASPSRSGDNGTARPGSAPRARAPTSLAHPPGGGRDGVGGRRSSREIRSEPPREFSNARDTASGADGGGLRTTVPGMPRGSRFRSRPGGVCVSRRTLGAVVPGLPGPAPGKARSWPLPRTSWGLLWSPAPSRRNPQQGESWPCVPVSVSLQEPLTHFSVFPLSVYLDFIESQNSLGWKVFKRSSSSNPPPPRAMEHPQLLWATCFPASSPSHTSSVIRSRI